MICINCSSPTKVTNSRPHKKTPSVWRRRQCTACQTVFTTMEMIADTAYTFRVIRSDGAAEDFSLPRLLLSISAAVSHRPAPASADEAYWLAQTVAQNIQATASDSVTLAALTEESLTVISNFDATAGLQYGARHGLIKNTAQKPKRGRPRTIRRGIG